jgi:hypothetical protein
MKIRRVPVQDVLTVEGETAILVHGRALALSRAASCAWGQLSEDWRPVEAWFSEVVAMIGEPSDAVTARASLVDGLVAVGCAEVME